MLSEQMRQTIRENAAEIERLHRRIHVTRASITAAPESPAAWRDACAEFHARYDALAFPGGLAGAYERIAQGDPYTTEAAICFLEVRPYFFRSGYMYKDVLRKLKRAPLSPGQTARLNTILEKYSAWLQRKDATRR